MLETMKDMIDQIDCNLDHPIFEVLESETRRHILRLIACEHNYGNRIASILGMSTPAVHRHLKILQGEANRKGRKSLPIISQSEKSVESYSGYKGAEATLYQIKSQIGIFFGIFPNFIHSQIFRVNDKGEVTSYRASNSDTDFFLLRPPQKMPSSSSSNSTQYLDLYDKVQEYNKKIIVLQKELMEVLHEKNKVMEDVDKIINSENELDFEDRVIMRAITCLGPECSSNLAEILKMDDVMVNKHVEKILEKGFLEKMET